MRSPISMSRHNARMVNLGVVLAGRSKILALTYGNHLAEPQGLQVNDAGQVAILDTGVTPPTIYTYVVDGLNLGRPVATTQLLNSSYPTSFAFAPGSHRVLISDADVGGEVYLYPSGGHAVLTVTMSTRAFPQFIGTAINPTQQFAR